MVLGLRCAAGAVSRTATAPLDRVKVILQLQPISVPLRQAARVIMQQELSGKASTAVADPAYSGAATATRRNSGSAAAICVERKLSQSSKQDEGTALRQQHRKQAVREAVLRPLPPSVIKRGSCSSKANSSNGSCCSHFFLGGWRGFFRGNLTNCLKVVPETAVKFYSYDICKHTLARRKQQQQQPEQAPQQQHEELGEPHLQLMDKFLCGAMAGLCAQLLIYPMELVNTT